MRRNAAIFVMWVFFQGVFSNVNAEVPTIAILDFQNNSFFQAEELGALQPGLADMMITALSRVSGLKVVERRQLRALLEEMALGQSGVVDAATAQKVGKLLGAEYLLLGSFVRGMKNDLRIDVRMVRTETGETTKAEEVTGKTEDVLKLVEKLSKKVLKNLRIKLAGDDKRRLEGSLPDCGSTAIMKYFRALELADQKDYDRARKVKTYLENDSVTK
ncbi:MAG: hypothetical protein Kow0037_28470 [Calditrichia bacterium]